MTLADMDDLLMKGAADEIDVGKIREGMPAEIKVGAFPDRPVSGKLLRVSLKSHQKDNATLFDVEIADLRAPDGVRLRAGYSANADIIIRRAVDVPVIPERAIEFRGDSTFVRLPSHNGADPEERPVVLGMSDGIRAEVVSGLRVGDRVLEKQAKEIK